MSSNHYNNATPSSRSNTASSAVLITTPKFLESDDGAVKIERERCHSIDLSQQHQSSPSAQGRSINSKSTSTSVVMNPSSLPRPELSLSGSNHEEKISLVRRSGSQPEIEQATDDDPATLQSSSPPSRSSSRSSRRAPTRLSSTPVPADDEDDDCDYRTFLLGKCYHPIHDYAIKRVDEQSLFWFTYRCDFLEISPYNITTDAGWGCMLRSAQMMLGQVLRLHYRSREWVPPQSFAKRKSDPFLQRILQWFADFPSQQQCVFSLHNMVAAGLAKYETLPGEWYGPGTACHVIRDLCQMQEEREGKGGERFEQQQQQHDYDDNQDQSALQDSLRRPFFRVYVAPQGSVYRDAVEVLMTRDASKEAAAADNNAASEGSNASEPQHPLSHPLDPAYDDTDNNLSKQHPWDTALLILIPLRLGLKNFNTDYAVPLAHALAFKQSVGILGGRPRGARWFYGADSNGTNLYGLDPHTIQSAPLRTLVQSKDGGEPRFAIAVTDDYLRSIHTTYPDIANLRRVDPSLALGFYCGDRSDFEDLCGALALWQKEHGDLPDLFTVADAVPDYSANVSSVMNEMMGGIADSFALDDEGHVSDEDEYVML